MLARQKGNYLARPRWAARPRRGRWSVEFLVYGADELDRMSAPLIESVVAASVRKREIKDALREGRLFSGEGLAEGIGRLLWRCPVCGKADSVTGAGDVIGCRHCGARWALDANCRVAPLNVPLSLHAEAIADLEDWHAWQISTLPQLAAEAGRPGLGLASEGVILSSRKANAIRRLGRGRLRLCGLGADAELVFESKELRLSFEAGSIKGFVDNFNAFSEFGYRGERWRVEFGGGNAAKWSYALGRGGSRADGPEVAA